MKAKDLKLSRQEVGPLIHRPVIYIYINIGGTLLAGGTTVVGTPLAVGTTPNTR